MRIQELFRIAQCFSVFVENTRWTPIVMVVQRLSMRAIPSPADDALTIPGLGAFFNTAEALVVALYERPDQIASDWHLSLPFYWFSNRDRMSASQ